MAMPVVALVTTFQQTRMHSQRIQQIQGQQSAVGRRALTQRRAVPLVVCQAASNDLAGKRIVLIGGSGRVGSSTASALLKTSPGIEIAIAGRSQDAYHAALHRRPDLKATKFTELDINDEGSIKAALLGADLVIHAAGPFQQSRNHMVLEQAISAKVPYIDVCDDLHYAEREKAEYSEKAKAAGVPAIISAGIYPGTSNVMAAHIISIARKEYDSEWNYRTPSTGEGLEPKLLRYSYYTAGSGGAGPTILQTSILLAGEPVTVYKEGGKLELPPISNRRTVDFGPGIGRKGVYLYNLPEIESAKKYMRVPGVSARFGTDPPFWNWAMWATARFVPRHLLNDRDWVKWFAGLSDPMVRTVDKWAGEAVAMKIEVDFENGKSAGGIFVHRYLGQSMGYSVGAFAEAVLRGQTKPGVWYPEEPEALADRRAFLRYAAHGCERFDLNRSLWALESEPKQVGGLIYW